MEILGERLWDKFNAPYEEQKWYYQSLSECFEGLEDYVMYREYMKTVRLVFGDAYE